ncbi:28267_t:CDS:1, partial [Racocetra persica]
MENEKDMPFLGDAATEPTPGFEFAGKVVSVTGTMMITNSVVG